MVRRIIKKELKRNHKQTRQRAKRSMPQEPHDDSRFYVIEELLDKRMTSGGEEYLVRWKNYPPIWDSWEPAEEIEKNSADMIREFNRIQDKGDTSLQLHCICRKAYRFEQGGMIQCSNCQMWLHFTCLNMNMEEANLYRRYYCESCQKENPNLKSSFKKEKLGTFYGKSLSEELSTITNEDDKN